MVDMDSWSTVLRLKERLKVIKLELAKIDRFVTNPFKNNTLSSEKRKELWEKAVRKKKELEKEISETNKTIKELVAEEKAKVRMFRRKKK
jgi:hypothetical protein